MATLNAIAAQPDQKSKIEQYKTALQQIINNGSVKECRGFADHSEDLVPCPVGNQLLLPFLRQCLQLHPYGLEAMLLLPQYCQTTFLWSSADNY